MHYSQHFFQMYQASLYSHHQYNTDDNFNPKQSPLDLIKWSSDFEFQILLSIYLLRPKISDSTFSASGGIYN
jgi:hypothetical protein